MSKSRKAFRPFAFEKGFGLSVANLLTPITPDGCPSMVPDHRSSREPHGPSLFLQPPANINVVTGGPIQRVEAADRRQARTPECHIASGHMFGDLVGQENMKGPARRVCNALSDPTILGWNKVGPPDANMIGA